MSICFDAECEVESATVILQRNGVRQFHDLSVAELPPAGGPRAGALRTALRRACSNARRPCRPAASAHGNPRISIRGQRPGGVWHTEEQPGPLRAGPTQIADELAQHIAGKSASDFVFTPWRRCLVARHFRRRVFDAASGVAGLDGLTPHELRHTAASLAVSAGANVKAVQRMLGHASAAMTLDVYSGLFDDDLDGLADRLDAILADSVRTEAIVTTLEGRRASG
jgi:integrase